jgi:hypothetical protein
LRNYQAENMIAHKDEIYSRPKRTWFATEKEKKTLAKAAKVGSSYSFMNVILSDAGCTKKNLLVFYIC